MFDTYFICTAPRSGSTLLCRLLTATGAAGRPESYFHRPSLEAWKQANGVAASANADELAVLGEVFQAVLRDASDGCDLRGIRLQAHSLPFFLEQLRRIHPGTESDKARIERIFGSTCFIHLKRPGKLDQAVSYLIAEQSGLWHRNADGSELERLAPHKDPLYDFDRIAACKAEMADYDATWDTWFQTERISPLRVTYPDLASDPLAVLRRVLVALGKDPKCADGVTPPVRKLADATNAAWVERFLADGEARNKKGAVKAP
ncbi:MAG: sulfotransferase [Rhodobacteraceae bacterium]|nr:sulfotransferase [Paracoccaceae bacterium]